jgi:predicted nuclease of predicted toxin-antitoxin system
VKLLFDQNLSHKLIASLADEFPGSAHVRDCALHDADDTAVWEFARANGYAIVSKDDDFKQRSFLMGCPPKVVWLRLGNCTTREVLEVLRRHARDLVAFDSDPTAAFMALG